MALQLMLIEPNLDYVPKTPYNAECAQLFRDNKPEFLQRVSLDSPLRRCTH